MSRRWVPIASGARAFAESVASAWLLTARALTAAALLAGCASSSGQAGLANAPVLSQVNDPSAHDSITNGAEGCGAGATRPAQPTAESIRRERIAERRRARGEQTDLDEGLGGPSAMCKGVGRFARRDAKAPAPITYFP